MKKLLKNLWLFPVIIITALGIRAVIHSESLVDLNVTGGISANDNPVILNNGLRITGDIELTSGGSITSTANGDITFTPNGTGDVNWTSQNSTMTTAGALTTGSNLIVGGDITVNGHTTIGNAVTDDINLRGLPRLPSNADPRANNIVPTYAAGTLIWNSTLLSVCVSSGTVATSWVKIEAPTTACQ